MASGAFDAEQQPHGVAEVALVPVLTPEGESSAALVTGSLPGLLIQQSCEGRLPLTDTHSPHLEVQTRKQPDSLVLIESGLSRVALQSLSSEDTEPVGGVREGVLPENSTANHAQISTASTGTELSAGREARPADASIEVGSTSDVKPKELETSEATKQTALAKMFGPVLTASELATLQAFDGPQQAAFVAAVSEIVTNSGMKKTAERRFLLLGQILAGESALGAVQNVDTLETSNVYSDMSFLKKVFSTHPDVIHQVITNIQKLVDLAKKSQETYIKENREYEFVQLIEKLLGGRRIRWEGISALEKHLTGNDISPGDWGDFLEACNGMRGVIDQSVDILRRHRPDARTGLLTKQDAWLLDALLGNPATGRPPITLQIALKFVKRWGDPAPVTLNDMRLQSKGAIRRLNRTRTSY